jgi:hypothetical protein
MKDLNIKSKKNFPIVKLFICAVINSFIYIYLLPIAAASHATKIPDIIICTIYFVLCLLIASRAKSVSELLFLSIISFLLTLIFLRLLGQSIVINRYINIVDNPDDDERHMHSTDRLGMNVNMIGFLIASSLVGLIRVCSIIIKNEKTANQEKKEQDNELNTNDN